MRRLLFLFLNLCLVTPTHAFCVNNYTDGPFSIWVSGEYFSQYVVEPYRHFCNNNAYPTNKDMKVTVTSPMYDSVSHRDMAQTVEATAYATINIRGSIDNFLVEVQPAAE